MFKYSLSLLLAATLFACNTPPENKTDDEMNDDMASMNMEEHKPGDIIDPVCGMVKDSTWTDYTIYKGDTVWFCAESEKTAFLADPAKYEDALKKNK